MNSLFQIEIPKRNSNCAMKGERLVPGMDIYSLLLEGEGQSLKRLDYCLSCWDHHASVKEELKSMIRGHWKSQIEKRKIVKESSKIERAFSLLKELQQNPEAFEPEIFVLCLFLSHARQISLRQEFQKDGNIYQLYEVLRKEEFFTVKSIRFSQIQIESIQKSIAERLSV